MVMRLIAAVGTIGLETSVASMPIETLVVFDVVADIPNCN